MKSLIVNDLNNIGDTLRHERELLHKTRQQICDVTGVHINTLNRVENGHGFPQLEVLYLWATALGYDEIVIKITG